jgi:hypothetical protein
MQTDVASQRIFFHQILVALTRTQASLQTMNVSTAPLGQVLEGVSADGGPDSMGWREDGARDGEEWTKRSHTNARHASKPSAEATGAYSGEAECYGGAQGDSNSDADADADADGVLDASYDPGLDALESLNQAMPDEDVRERAVILLNVFPKLQPEQALQ